jgi:hypothetical protein
MGVPVDQGWSHMWRVLTAAGEVLAEANRAPLDDSGWREVVTAHRRLLVEAGSALSEDLIAELQRLLVPFENHELTPAEAALAQAQLVGWLTGLMEGLRTGLVGVRIETVG